MPIKRVRCPECGAVVAVTRHGVIRAHAKGLTYVPPEQLWCPGAGRLAKGLEEVRP